MSKCLEVKKNRLLKGMRTSLTANKEKKKRAPPDDKAGNTLKCLIHHIPENAMLTLKASITLIMLLYSKRVNERSEVNTNSLMSF